MAEFLLAFVLSTAFWLGALVYALRYVVKG